MVVSRGLVLGGGPPVVMWGAERLGYWVPEGTGHTTSRGRSRRHLGTQESKLG